MNKTILHINSSNFGSTGNIMMDLSRISKEHGYIPYVSYPKSRTNMKKIVENSVYIGNILSRNLNIKLSYLTGFHNFFSHISTILFIKKIKKINPVIIHIHNLHHGYINLKRLFNHIIKNNIYVVWTFHDCWPFTGQCVHYSDAGCSKWQSGCHKCPIHKTSYPTSIIDQTKIMYNIKKNLFTQVYNMHIVTPSNWLKKQVQMSFLKKFEIQTIYNGIDLDIFKPTPSNFREKHNLEDKKILLGVANVWSDRKGLKILIEIMKIISNEFVLVIVGSLNNEDIVTDDKIIFIPKTMNRRELAEIYTAADLFINPSREESMGLVTIEALACGTPAIVSSLTAVPESVSEKCGMIVRNYTSYDFREAILKADKYGFNSIDCVAKAQEYNRKDRYIDYIEIYDSIIEKSINI